MERKRWNCVYRNFGYSDRKLGVFALACATRAEVAALFEAEGYMLISAVEA